MSLPPLSERPIHSDYDVIIAGGAMMGSAVAWALMNDPAFDGRVLIVEPDPTYQRSATALSGSCIRQQYSNAINVQISQYGVEYIRRFRDELGGDREVPDIPFETIGYLFLATDAGAPALRENVRVQQDCGAATELLGPAALAERFPFLSTDEVALASFNGRDEGWFDGYTMMQWWRQKARQRGAEYVTNAVCDLVRGSGATGERITEVQLSGGQRVACGVFVNAAGTRASDIAAMAGIKLEVEPRKRTTFVFEAERPIEPAMPLVIDPAGYYARSDGARCYLGAAIPDDDPAVAHDDFEVDYWQFDDVLWPKMAARIPAFNAIRCIGGWAGHYDYNVLDQNAVVGSHPEIRNFLFLNGFSGHGLQQAPALGRATAELIIHGGYRALDLSPLGYERLRDRAPFLETAVI